MPEKIYHLARNSRPASDATYWCYCGKWIDEEKVTFSPDHYKICKTCERFKKKSQGV